jgi:hypothetical protein
MMDQTRDDNPESQVEPVQYDPNGSVQSSGGMNEAQQMIPTRRASMGRNPRGSFNMNYIAPHRSGGSGGSGGSPYNTFMSNAMETEDVEDEEDAAGDFAERSFDDIDFDEVGLCS